MSKLKVFTNSQRTRIVLKTESGNWQFSTSLEPSIMDLAFTVALMHIKGVARFGEPLQSEISGCDKLVLAMSYNEDKNYIP